MNILIFSPSNLRAVDQQSQAVLFKKMGYEPLLLTCLPEGVLHRNFQEHGFKTYSSNITNSRGVIYFLKEIYFLVKFCKKHKVDAICCHLESCAIISRFAKYFIKAKVVYMRHNSDFVGNNNSQRKVSKLDGQYTFTQNNCNIR